MLGDRLHLHAVAHADAAESDLLAQQSDCGRAHRGRDAGVERVEDDMGGHHAGDARPHRRLERHELARAQALECMRKPRKIVVRVLVGIPVAREVLGACRDVLLQSGDHRCTERGHDLRIAGERAVADHGVREVRVDVDHGREVDVEARAAHLCAEPSADRAHVVGRALAELAHRRKRLESLGQPCDAAAFLVDREEERTGRDRLELADERARLVARAHIAGEEDHA